MLMSRLRIYAASLIPCLVSAFLAWRTVLQLDLPLGLEDYVIDIMLLMKGFKGGWISPNIFLPVVFLRFYDLSLSIKLTLALLYSLIPLPMYLFTYELFKSRLTALISSLLTSMLTVGLLSPPCIDEFLTFLLLPIVLIIIRRLTVRNSWLYAALLVYLVGLMLLSNPKICYLTSTILTLFLIYDRKYLLMLLPSIFLSYTSTIYYTLTFGLMVKNLNLDLLNPLIPLATACTLAGMYLAAKSRRGDLPYVAIPLVSMVIMLPTSINYMLLAIPALPLISSLSTLYRSSIQSFRIVEGGESVYEVTINLDRLIPLALIMILILASIYNVYVFTSSYKTLHSESSSIRRLSMDIKNLTPPGSHIIAPPNLSVWIEALTGLEVLSNYGYSVEVDAIASANYRLMNSYLIIDDTNPVTHQYTPRVKVYDGYEYRGLIAVSDGNVLLSVYNTTLNLNSKYVADIHSNETDNLLLLTTIYKLPLSNNLLITVEKIEALSKLNPTLNITYSINTYKSMLEAKIPLEVYGVAEFTVKDSEALITINQHKIHLLIKSNGDTNVNPINNTLIIKSQSIDTLNIKIMLTFPSAKKSQYKPWISSSKNLIEYLKVNYIVSEKLNKFLQMLQHDEAQLIRFYDNSIRVLGVKDGRQFSQEVSNILEAGGSMIYEASNFIVSISLLNNSIVYEVKPKNSTLNLLVLSYEASLDHLRNWIIEQNEAIFEYRDFSIKLVFSKGFHTDVKLKASKLEAAVMIPLNQRGDMFNIYFESSNSDVMVRKDENRQVLLYARTGFLSNIYEFSEYVVYRVDISE
jgi:hypothetical protein